MKRQKYTLEFPFKNIPVNVLWTNISTSFGLSEWFADNVTGDDENYTFWWSKQPSVARVVSKKPTRSIRFQWEDDEDTDYYFELSIVTTELSGDVSLIVTDFADHADYDDSVLLWNQELDRLRRRVGA